MANIQIAFYKSNQSNADWTDKLIAWWTKGPYSHAELIIDGYMYSTSPRDLKVRKKKHIIDINVWDYVNIEIPQIENGLEFFNQVKGEPYDWFGILGFVLPFKDRTNEWFCSEFVSNFLKVSGYKKLFKYEPSKISPNKLYKILKGE